MLARSIVVLVLGLAIVGGAWPQVACAESTSHEKDSHGKEDHVDDLSHGDAGDQLEEISEVRLDLAIWSFVVFLLLLAILWKFAWGPISQGLASREKSIADNIRAAEEAGEEAKKFVAEYEAKLAGAADEVRTTLEEARRDSEHTKQQIVEEGKQAAQAELDRALREIETAKDQAVRQLAEQSASAAVDLAGRILRKQLSADDHEQLIQDAIARFQQSSPSSN